MHKLYKYFWILLLASFFFVFGCQKIDRSTVKTVNGIVDSTETCGFLVKIKSSSIIYNAINLPMLYQHDTVKVVISYHPLDSKFYCIGGPANGYPQIYIDAIHKE